MSSELTITAYHNTPHSCTAVDYQWLVASYE